MSNYEELWTLIQAIPPGHVASYGALGKAMRNPISGLLVGRWIKASPTEIPWWRVVGKDGRLPIAKQSPHLALEQEERLRSEGITLEGGRVPTAAFVSISDLADD